MTRERLLEKAIAEWFEQEDCEIYDSTPQTLVQPLGNPPRPFSLTALAAHLDEALPRILREATSG